MAAPSLLKHLLRIWEDPVFTAFRQETGQTFIKYLTDYRLEKAKEMLLGTSKKSAEISLLVGYKDPHYFSYLFKKTQGMTTTQYRGKSRVEVEE